MEIHDKIDSSYKLKSHKPPSSKEFHIVKINSISDMIYENYIPQPKSMLQNKFCGKIDTNPNIVNKLQVKTVLPYI